MGPACKGIPDTALSVWPVEPSQSVCDVAPVSHSSTLKPLFLVRTLLAPSEIVTTAASPSYWPSELYWGVVWYGPALMLEPVGSVVTCAETGLARAVRPISVRPIPNTREVVMILRLINSSSFDGSPAKTLLSVVGMKRTGSPLQKSARHDRSGPDHPQQARGDQLISWESPGTPTLRV